MKKNDPSNSSCPSFLVGMFILAIASVISIKAIASDEIEGGTVAAMKKEAADLQRQLMESEQMALDAGTMSTSDLAARVLLIEDLLLKLHEILDAENKQRELSIERDSSLRELQQALAEAPSREERRFLLIQHQALQRTIAHNRFVTNPPTSNTSK